MTERINKRSFKYLPLSVHIETLGGIATPLILRGTALPAKRSQTFSTATDNQEAITVKLFIGESPIASHNKPLGSFVLKGIPKAKRGVSQITVTFEIDHYLEIAASAIEQQSQAKISVDIDAQDQFFTDEKIRQILLQHEASKEKDDKLLKEIETKNKAAIVLEEAEEKVRSDQAAGKQNKEIEKGIAELGLALDSGNSEDIKEKTQILESAILFNKGSYTGQFGDIFSDIFSSPFSQKNTKGFQKRAVPSQVKSKKTTVQTAVAGSQLAPSQRETLNVGKIFGGGSFTLDPNLCFVLMPFTDKMTPIYDDHIKPVVEKNGLTSLRADEIVGVNSIIQDIWEKINRARFLIADLTGKNANVFYEVGIAHTLGKDVILLTQNINDVPFDLKHWRCIVYAYNPRSVKEMENKLKATIKEIMQAT
jgi:hypothetical protein